MSRRAVRNRSAWIAGVPACFIRVLVNTTTATFFLLIANERQLRCCGSISDNMNRLNDSAKMKSSDSGGGAFRHCRRRSDGGFALQYFYLGMDTLGRPRN